MPFTDAQCHDHFSRAFFKSCQTRDESSRANLSVFVAMGVAHTRFYQKYSDRIAQTRRELGIGLFWVRTGGEVTLEEEWRY